MRWCLIIMWSTCLVGCSESADSAFTTVSMEVDGGVCVPAAIDTKDSGVAGIDCSLDGGVP
jgi:hypothetical protein